MNTEQLIVNDERNIANNERNIVKNLKKVEELGKYNHSQNYYIINFDVYISEPENRDNIENRDLKIDYYEQSSNYNTFMYLDARIYNMQRIRWINSVLADYDLKGKNILEVGCGGCGDFTRYFLSKGCNIYACDARQECLDLLKSRVPSEYTNNVTYTKLNVENLEEFNNLPMKHFDVILCVGLLYHISNPTQLLDKMRELGNFLLLETMITNSNIFENVIEDSKNINQSFSGNGNLINKNYLKSHLEKLYDCVDDSEQPKSSEIESGKRWTFVCNSVKFV